MSDGRKGGLDLEDVARQAEVLQKAAAASPIRQVSHQLVRLADAFKNATDAIMWAADEEIPAAVELAGTLVPGMRILGDKGEVRLIRVIRRDGDWALHVKYDNWEQAAEHNGGKLEEYLPLAADGASPVVVRA